MKKNMKKKKQIAEERCKHLYVDVFGHPYCKCGIENYDSCEYSLPSEEYHLMKMQMEYQKKEIVGLGQDLFKVVSIYRCTKYDMRTDENGHLPNEMRARISRGYSALTIG